jgi:hypothetical protein
MHILKIQQVFLTCPNIIKSLYNINKTNSKHNNSTNIYIKLWNQKTILGYPFVNGNHYHTKKKIIKNPFSSEILIPNLKTWKHIFLNHAMEETKIKVKRKKRDTLKFHKHDENFREGNRNTYNNKSSLEFKFNTLTH